jgi:RHS repeat-associated protein
MLQDISALPAFEPDAPQQRDPERTPHCLEWRAHYDALGRRLWTEWTTPDGEMRRRDFYWDGDRLAAEILPSGKLRIYQYGSADALSPLQFTEYGSVGAAPESGETYHLFYDASGQALSIENGGGVEVWRAERVDPYGLHELRPCRDIEYSRPGTALDYNLRWPGHYLDPETGLHYNRYRYYDPRLGRYLQSDPIGYEGSPVNLYAYCANPLVQVDVLGLDHEGKVGNSKESGDVDGQEGTSKASENDGRTPPGAPSQRALAAAANDGADGNASPAQLAARRAVAEDFVRKNGMKWDRSLGKAVPLPEKEIAGQIKGVDFNRPVHVGPPPDFPGQLSQWQPPGNYRGSFFSEPQYAPDQLGIGPEGRAWGDGGIVKQKEATSYTFENTDQMPYMKSTAGRIDDDWSIPEHNGDPAVVQPTNGGGEQYLMYGGCDQNNPNIAVASSN